MKLPTVLFWFLYSTSLAVPTEQLERRSFNHAQSGINHRTLPLPPLRSINRLVASNQEVRNTVNHQTLLFPRLASILITRSLPSTPPPQDSPPKTSPPQKCDPSLPPPDSRNSSTSPGTCNTYVRNYPPSSILAIIFSLLFSTFFVAHLFQAIHHPSPRQWIIVEGAGVLLGCYVLRISGTSDEQNPWIVSASDILLLMAPIVLNAFVNTVFARTVNFYSAKRRVWGITAATIDGVIICASFFPFMIQLAASILVGPLNARDVQMEALSIYLIGISLQQIIIFSVLVLAINFHLDIIKSRSDKLGFRHLIYSIYGSLVAISVRIFFRLVELSRGFGASYVMSHMEIFFYAFEAVPMLVVLGLWSFVRPGKYLRDAGEEEDLNWFRNWGGYCFRRDGRGKHRLSSSEDGEDEVKGLMLSNLTRRRQSEDR